MAPLHKIWDLLTHGQQACFAVDSGDGIVVGLLLQHGVDIFSVVRGRNISVTGDFKVYFFAKFVTQTLEESQDIQD